MNNINDYTILCTEAQTKTLHRLGIEMPMFKCTSEKMKEAMSKFHDTVEIEDNLFVNTPTADQVLCWLSEKGIILCKDVHSDVITEYAVDINNNESYMFVKKTERDKYNLRESVLEFISVALYWYETKGSIVEQQKEDSNEEV